MTETAPYRTKMIEVGLPLEAINAACKREKSIRHGHPSTLHLYWARRPLAACRAVLFSSLVDDPSADPAYKDKGEEAIQERRQELHDLLAELVLWESSNDERIINRARAEIASSLASFAAEKSEIDTKDWPGVIERTAKPELVNKYLAEVAPPVLDPFAGGGSIPLEAQRLGLRAYASDLNPVAVLINKALIEIPPKFANQPPINPEAQEDNLGTKTWKGAQGLAEDVRYYGQWMRDEAEKRIGHLYPKVKITPEMVKERPDLKKYQGQELTAIAWIWARTVGSPDPAARGKHVPLLATHWLCKKQGKYSWLETTKTADGWQPRVHAGATKPQLNVDGTVGRGGGQCLLTGTTISLDHIRIAGQQGKLGRRLVACVAESRSGRVYLDGDTNLEKCIANEEEVAICPTSPLPKVALGFRVQKYGFRNFEDLFSPEQTRALCVLSELLDDVHEELSSNRSGNSLQYADALRIYLGLVISRCAGYWSTLCSWHNSGEKIRDTFGRQALPMVWDYAVANPFSTSSGCIQNNINWVAKVIANLPCGPAGAAEQRDATQPINNTERLVISTDPPYYDNIGYADLSDYFYLWIRHAIGSTCFLDMDTLQTPKSAEAIATPGREGRSATEEAKFFESSIGKAVKSAAHASCNEIPLTIYYAYKQQDQTEEGATSTGWVTFLSALIDTKLQITATVPIRTEGGARLRAHGSNALASSIVLACRSRAVDAGLTTRTNFVRELRTHLGKALADLQQSSIAPVDLQQAAIGPGMAVFSKYAKVLENDGSEMSVRAALGLINQALEEVLSEQEGEFDADTRFATIWFEQFGFDTGDYGTAETLAKAKAISVDGVVDSGILESTGGNVRLLKPEELDEDWKPEEDDRLTVWEVTHYLCRALETGGIDGAAELVRRVGGLADSARDLAYRLFSICDKKKWATEAQPYNALVASWPDIQNAAAAEPIAATTDSEGTLFEG